MEECKVKDSTGGTRIKDAGAIFGIVARFDAASLENTADEAGVRDALERGSELSRRALNTISKRLSATPNSPA
jgi:hypothetical protein